MLKSFKELKVWQKSYSLMTEAIENKTSEIERMLKGLINSLENQR